MALIEKFQVKVWIFFWRHPDHFKCVITNVNDVEYHIKNVISQQFIFIYNTSMQIECLEFIMQEM